MYASNKESQQIDQDLYAQSSGASPSGNERYAIKQDQYANNQQNGNPHRGQDHFDDIDVDLDVDINNSDKMKVRDDSEDASDDYLQDDIPIDEDDDEDGIISDNYDNFDKTGPIKSDKIPSPNLSASKPDSRNEHKAPMDDNIISMEHSDDLDQSHKPRSGFAIPIDKSSSKNSDDKDEDEIEDEDEEGLDMDSDDYDDMEGMEGMNREELEQAMLVAGLMQDMAGEDDEDEDDNYSSEKGGSVQE